MIEARITRYVHRDYCRAPRPVLTQVVVAEAGRDWHLHVHLSGMRTERWVVPACVGPEALDALLPPDVRVEDPT
jgi:hypothetical protein